MVVALLDKKQSYDFAMQQKLQELHRYISPSSASIAASLRPTKILPAILLQPRIPLGSL
jgi:hypothetical protein